MVRKLLKREFFCRTCAEVNKGCHKNVVLRSEFRSAGSLLVGGERIRHLVDHLLTGTCSRLPGWIIGVTRQLANFVRQPWCNYCAIQGCLLCTRVGHFIRDSFVRPAIGS